MAHRVYLIPGMFGFGRLAGYDYFEHVERMLGSQFAARGVSVHMEVVGVLPTASIRRRARAVAEHVHRTAQPGEAIHLVGHSTGGLDARLLSSPSAWLDLEPTLLDWRAQLRSVVTINSPHYGTPLAQLFATVSGTRLLYALSLMTVATLTLGRLPLTILSTLFAALESIDGKLHLPVPGVERLTALVLRYLGEDNRREVWRWLEGVRMDQGGIIQISPEAMDLFNAATESSPDVRYGCVVTTAPTPIHMRFVRALLSPYTSLSAAIFSVLYAVTARAHRTYPYPRPSEPQRAQLRQAVSYEVTEYSNDGVVPTLSMLWGELLWCGEGDHLDVVGHFRARGNDQRHVDWLCSGADFSQVEFEAAFDAVARFLLASA